MLKSEIYDERQSVHPAGPILLIIAAVYEIAIACLIRSRIGIHIFQAAMAISLITTALIFRQMWIRVDSGDLYFGFGIVRQRISLSKIQSVRIVDSKVLTMGFGIHLLTKGVWAWIAKPGPAIEIVINDPRSPNLRGFVLSTARPKAFVDALKIHSGRDLTE